MAPNDENDDSKLRQSLIDQYSEEYKELDKEIVEKVIDYHFDLYDLLDDILSVYSPRKFHYFVHEKKGIVRALAPTDPDCRKTQYLPGDDTPMVLTTFDHVISQYPSQIAYILNHPRAHRAP